MSVTDKLRKYRYRLNSDAYVQCVSNFLSDTSIRKPVDPEIREVYVNHLPRKLARFLKNCYQLTIGSSPEKIDFNLVNFDYVISLIYTGLRRRNTVKEKKSVPLQASLFFMSLRNSAPEKFVNEWNGFHYLFNKVLRCLEKRVKKKCYLSVSIISQLICFLTNTRINFLNFVPRILTLLRTNIVEHSNCNFETEFKETVDQVTYIYLLTIIDTIDDAANKPQVFVTIISKVLEIYDTEIPLAQENVLKFYRELINKASSKLWYRSALVQLFNASTNEITTFLLNNVQFKHYANMFFVILEEFSDNIHDDNVLLDRMDLIAMILNNLHPYVVDTEKYKYMYQIIRAIYRKINHKNNKVVDKVMSFFVMFMRSENPYLIQFCRQMVTNEDDEVCGKNIFNRLLTNCDFFNHTSYNAKFVEITCLMFSRRDSFVTDRHLKIIEVLLSRANNSSTDLESCIPVFKELILTYLYIHKSLVNLILKYMSSVVLKFRENSISYVQALFFLISNCFVRNAQHVAEFDVCDILLSEDVGNSVLFEMMIFFHFIRKEEVEVLVQDKIVISCTAWKLLDVLLNTIKFYQVPKVHMKFLFVDYYESEEVLHSLNVIIKVLKQKIENNIFHPNDMVFITSLENTLILFISKFMIPGNVIDRTVELVLNLSKISGGSKDWILLTFARCKNSVFKNITDMTATALIAKQLTYMRVLMKHADVVLTKFDIYKYTYLMSEKFQISIKSTANAPSESIDTVWCSLLDFCGGHVLKCSEISGTNIMKIRFALLHGAPNVKLAALTVLFEICHLEVDYFNSIDPLLILVAESHDRVLSKIALRLIMKLLNQRRIQISNNEFVRIFLVLLRKGIQPNSNDDLENEFFELNLETLIENFMYILIYINDYQHHRLPQLAGHFRPLITYNHAKKISFYKLAYFNLDLNSQLNILHNITINILEDIYKSNELFNNNASFIFDDVLILVTLTAMKHCKVRVQDGKTFHREIMTKIINSCVIPTQNKMATLPHIETPMIILLNFLYKTNMTACRIPPLFAVIIYFTNAFYEELVSRAHSCNDLYQLYSKLPKFYELHLDTIDQNPVNLTKEFNKEEVNIHLRKIADFIPIFMAN